MPSLYSANLRIELMTTGDKSGVWGSITNTNLGSTSSAASGLEQAIVGTAVCATGDFTANVATYTLIDDPAYQVARAFVLNVTATLSAPGIINVPAIFKPYLVFNNSVGGFAVTVKVAGQTGVSVPNGKKAWLYNNGTDVGVAMDYLPTLALGTALPVSSGGTGLNAVGASTYLLSSTGSAMTWVAPSTIPAGSATNITGGATGSLPYQSAPSTTTFLPIGTTNYVLTAGATAPQYVAQSTLAVGTANNIAGGSANRVAYQTGVGTTGFVATPVTAGNALIWDGTNVTWGTGPASSSASNLAGGGAYTVVYQSSVGTTAYLTNGTTGQVLLANTGAAPSWGALVTGPSTAKTYYMAQF
tara:strand:+ start:3137 stop:4210 length:1074 start_codon:yes stop_codon:yes gene_type:complete